MFAETRMVATVSYLALICITLGVAYGMPDSTGGKTPLIIVCVISQFLALCWYTLSYIPFARQAVLSCLQGCCKFS